MPGSRTCKRPRIVPLNIHNGLVQRRRGTHNPPIGLAVVSPRASPYDTTVPPRPSRWPGRTGRMLNYERVFSLKCDNLLSLDSGPLPFCFPVSEVPPPEDSHLASGGDSQPETFAVKSREWVDHETPFLVASHSYSRFGRAPNLLLFRSDGSRSAGT